MKGGMRSRSDPALTGKIKGVFARAQDFFTSRAWTPGDGDQRPRRAWLYRASRIVYATVRTFIKSRLTFRAAALTYYSVLSTVPFLAFAFSAAKGFGAYKSLLDGALRPYLYDTFGANPSLLRV